MRRFPACEKASIRRLAGVVAALTILLASAPAKAFKIDTHVWLAQQVLNDALDGTIDVRLTNPARTVRIAVPPPVLRALRRFPEYFRMGSIGPDAFPDVFIGQTIIHPSVPHGWGAADWLRHLNDPSLSDEHRAFAVGNLVHAAADIFAHTYVNRYAGDVFELSKQAASIRHVRLESFLSHFTPTLVEANGHVLGKAHATLKRPDGTLAIPADFVREHMYFSPAALAELTRSGKAPHIPLIHSLRQNLQDALNSDGFVDGIETLAIQISAQLFADVALSKEQARQVRDLSEKIHNMSDFSEESIKLVDEVDKALLDVHVFTKEQLSGFFAATEQAVGTFRQVRADIESKKNDVLAKKKSIEGQLDETIEKVCKEVCNTCPKIPNPLNPTQQIDDPLCQVVCNKVCDDVKTVNTFKRDVQQQIENLESEVQRLVDSDLDRIKAIHAALLSAMDAITAAAELKLQLNQIALEYFSKDQAKSPLRRILENWHDDINTAMSAFVTANGQSMINTITDGAEDPLKPYREWFDCYAKGIVGIPILVTKGVCTVQQGLENIKAKLDEVEANLAKITPVTEALHKLKGDMEANIAKLRKELISQGTDAIFSELGKLANIDVLLWKEVFTSPTGETELNAEFAVDKSNGGLLIIPDIAKRVLAEMRVGKDGFFDGARFAPVANAVTLAKIALLDSGGLRELARQAGIVDSVFGEYLYSGDPAFAGNVLYGFAKSIDGNHQWHRLAPPHPRQTGYDEAEFRARRDDADKGFTYVDDVCEPVRGMRQWLDPLARPLVFERLFVGPLAAGVDLPANLGAGFPPVLPGAYPNTVTASRVWGLDGAELPIARMSREVEIGGRAGKGLTVTLSRGADQVGSANVDQSGHWRFLAKLSLTRSEWLTLKYSNAKGKQVGELATTYCDSNASPGSPGQTIQAYVTVVKSHSLWRIAELMTGRGENYVTLYRKNRHLIQDEDLIFPGQILLVPRESEWDFQQ
jgi:hypothetical protein